MKQKIDFIFNEIEDDEREVFRFYPRRSHVHGFGEKCPQTWEQVYKVYYCWSIYRQDKWNPEDNWESRLMFEMYCDECSELGNVSCTIDELIKCNEDKKSIYLNVIGDGADWKLTFYTKEQYIKEDIIEFQTWNRVTHQGYKFSLFVSEAKKFKEYIDMVQEYMLAHSEPI